MATCFLWDSPPPGFFDRAIDYPWESDDGAWEEAEELERLEALMDRTDTVPDPDDFEDFYDGR